MKEECKVVFSEDQVVARIKEIAAEIDAEYRGETVYLLCVLKGSIYFTCELARHMKTPVKFGFMSVSSYGDRLTSSGAVTMNGDVDFNVAGKNVLIIEDIIDSGRTISYISKMIAKRDPATWKICTLLDKPSRRAVDVKADYVGFEIPDMFVVGYGLDYAQRYRNLPYVAELILTEDPE